MEQLQSLQLEQAAPQSIEAVRKRLEVIRSSEKARYEHAQAERERLVAVDEPRSFAEIQQEREESIVAYAWRSTTFTHDELKRLKFYEREMKSLNLLVRAEARRSYTELHLAREQRERETARDLLERFRQEELPRLQEAYEESERRYEAYEVMAYLWEDEMNDAQVAAHLVPRLCEDLRLIERAGITTIEGIGEGADLPMLDRAIVQCWESIPEAQRKTLEVERLRERVAELQWGQRASVEMG